MPPEETGSLISTELVITHSTTPQEVERFFKEMAGAVLDIQETASSKSPEERDGIIAALNDTIREKAGPLAKELSGLLEHTEELQDEKIKAISFKDEGAFQHFTREVLAKGMHLKFTFTPFAGRQFPAAWIRGRKACTVEESFEELPIEVTPAEQKRFANISLSAVSEKLEVTITSRSELKTLLDLDYVNKELEGKTQILIEAIPV